MSNDNKNANIKNFVNILKNSDFTKFSKVMSKDMAAAVKAETSKLTKKGK